MYTIPVEQQFQIGQRNIQSQTQAPQTLRMKADMWYGKFGCQEAHYKKYIEGKDLRVTSMRSSKAPERIFRVVDETGEAWTVFSSWCLPIDFSRSVLVENSQNENAKIN